MRCHCGYKIRGKGHEEGSHHQHGNRGREERFMRMENLRGVPTNVVQEKTEMRRGR